MIDLSVICAELDVSQAEVEGIACTAHEAYRAYMRSRSDFTIVAWDQADNDDRNQMRAAVLAVMNGDMPILEGHRRSRLLWGIVKALHPKRM